MHHDVLRHLCIGQRLPTATLHKLNVQEHLIGTQRQLPPQFLFPIGAAVEREFRCDHAGGHVARGPSHQHPIGARKRFGSDVAFSLSGGCLITRGVLIGQKHATRRGSRR